MYKTTSSTGEVKYSPPTSEFRISDGSYGKPGMTIRLGAHITDLKANEKVVLQKKDHMASATTFTDAYELDSTKLNAEYVAIPGNQVR